MSEMTYISCAIDNIHTGVWNTLIIKGSRRLLYYDVNLAARQDA